MLIPGLFREGGHQPATDDPLSRLGHIFRWFERFLGGKRMAAITREQLETTLRIAGRGVSLRGTDLSGLDLSEMDLSHLDMSGADLTGAQLREASLAGANLRNACLENVQMQGA